ncbi:MAG: AraC family transcriptional regulator [Verrucomicrobia bacterium]|nr:AraC family transcriptional regulator [Verrucomicrobiota bacterium]
MIPNLTKETFFHPDGFPLVVTRSTSGRDYGMHTHEFSELVVITSGHGLHITETETWPITSGDVFVITGRRAHGYKDSEGLKHVNILYDHERLAIPATDLRSLPGYTALFSLEPDWRRRHRFTSRLRLSMKELALVDRMIDDMVDELNRRGPGFKLMSRALFMQMIGFLSRAYSKAVAPAPKQLFRIAEAISFLENNFDKDVYLDELAKMAHMSKRNFLRVFHETMGASPMEHLGGLRVARAAELLRQERLTVTEVGYRVGFDDSNYFARQFRKVMGLSPNEYRKQNRPHAAATGRHLNNA